MTVSLTAPRLTPEDLLRERQGLSDEERTCIDQDAYGIRAIPWYRYTPAELAEYVKQVQDYCLHGDSNDNNLSVLGTATVKENNERASYLRAMQLCPDLVATETDPLRFLRCERFDVRKASSRLLRYWTMREKIFGERAFRRMDLSGEGVLTHDDVASFERFGTFLLPHDDLGRLIVYGHRPAYSGLNSADFMVSTSDNSPRNYDTYF
jgi:hypothetical protein